MRPLTILLIILGVAIGAVGVVFHWKEKPGYDTYFLFAGILIAIGLLGA